MLKVLGSRVLVEPLEDAEKLASGLIVPQEARKKTIQAEVVAMGPGVSEDQGIRIGAKVLYQQYTGHEFKWNGKDVLALEEDEILAVVEA